MLMSPRDWDDGRNPYRQLRFAMDRLFSDFAQDMGAAVWPPINVWEQRDDFVLESEVPGVKMEQLEITCQGRDLTLRGERKDPGDPQDTYQRKERPMGSFVRSLTLPADLNADEIRATLEDGVLQITIPKAASAKPRRIEVKPSAQKEADSKEPVKASEQ